MIRLCALDDLPAVVAGESGAWKALKLPGVFNPEYFQSRLEFLMKAGLGVIVADFDEDGTVRSAMGGALSLEMHTGSPIAQQIFWTANRKNRGSAAIRVFKAFEAECFKRGAKQVYVNHLFDRNAKKMSDVFKRRFGYEPIQATYVRGEN